MIEPGGRVRHEHGAAGVATDAQARKTALVVAAVLLGVAAWNLYRGRTVVVAVAGGTALLLIVVALAAPRAARLFHAAWMRLAVALGYVNSRVLLTLMYYGVFAPYGLASRLAGRDPLRRRSGRGESYWVERKRTRQEREQFERLF